MGKTQSGFTRFGRIPLRSKIASGILIVVSILALFCAPIYLNNDYYIHILVLVCIFGAASVGWNLIGGFANQVSLGHAVFFGIGAYAVVIFQAKLDLSPWLAMPVGASISVVVALLIGCLTFRLSGHYFALSTLALLQIFSIIASYWKELTGGPVGLTLPILPSGLLNVQFDSSSSYLYIAGVLLIATLIVARFVRYSRLGLQLEAIRLNPQAAMLAGINIFQAKLKALSFGAVIVSLTGSLYACLLQFINPDTAFSFNTTVNMALFAIIGGVGFWWGPVVGAIILVPLAELASVIFSGQQMSALAQVIYGLLLVILIIMQPRGLGEWLSSLWSLIIKKRCSI